MHRPVEETIGSTPTKYLPKDVLALEFNPSKRLAHFVVELRNEPGALEHSAALATKHRVNILSGFHHAPSASQRAFWSFFADLTESPVNAAGFARELSSLTSTVNVRYNVPPNGLLIDGYHFPVQWGGQRAIMIRTESIGSIFARVNGIFGDGPAARVILFEMGEAAGRAIYKDLEGSIGSKIIRDELSNVLRLYACNGWGIVELLRADFGARTAAIRVTDNFECLPYKSRSAVPRSNFVRGHVAGWFSGMFGTRIEVIERHCVAKGDLTCEFIVQPPAVPE
jgi:predicted hydrocarbon binding protein